MKNIIKILSMVLSTFAIPAMAQNARFVKSGVVEYEKRVNMYAIIKKNITPDNETFWQKSFDDYKENNPQFKVLLSNLTFSNNATLFTPVAPLTAPSGLFKDLPFSRQNNIVFTDFSHHKRISQRQIFEQTFLVSDTIQKIRWKITDEVRSIAGYTCRRANGIILDSIYVVAFYSPQIPISGGPESFSGLPGLILGVALPHENISWFATKVVDSTVGLPSAPKSGRVITKSDFESQVKTIAGNKGAQSQFLKMDFLL